MAAVGAEVLYRVFPIAMLAAGAAYLAATDNPKHGEQTIESYTKESPPLAACFIARPGRTYQVRTSAQLSAWVLELFDRKTFYNVASPCKPVPAR